MTQTYDDIAAEPDGLFLLSRTCIETSTGLAFDLANPDPELVVLDDIASGLSKTCRYAGQCSRFYSVAEHSFLCWAMSVQDDQPHSVRKSVLFHDAHEGYCHDIARPLKHQIPSYGVIADDVQRAIAEKFDITALSHPAVKQYDTEVLGYEAAKLLPSRGVCWNLPDLPSRDLKIRCLYPWWARLAFLGACAAEGIGSLSLVQRACFHYRFTSRCGLHNVQVA